MSSTVERIYQRLAPIYDLVYGITLEHGRRRAMARLAPAAGESILEIGVSTGLSAIRYPRGCRVVAVDLSAPMLERAQARLARRGVQHVTLCRMDGSQLAFAAATFDAIYCAYVMNVVPDPLQVAREMLRVCRPGGRLVLLNHFDRANGPSHPWHDLAGRVATRVGVNWRIDLQAFLRDAGLRAESIEPVNIPRVSSVVVCHRA